MTAEWDGETPVDCPEIVIEYEEAAPPEVVEPPTRPHDVCPNCAGPVRPGGHYVPTLEAMIHVAALDRRAGAESCYRSAAAADGSWWYFCAWLDRDDRLRVFGPDGGRVSPPREEA